MFALLINIWFWCLQPEVHAFEKLSKWYAKSPAKCEAKASQWSRKHSDWSAPHFFLFRLDLDAFAGKENLHKKNRSLRNALTHARNLEKTDLKSFQASESYDSLKQELSALARAEYKRLLVENQVSKADILQRKMKLLSIEIPSEKPTTNEKSSQLMDTLSLGKSGHERRKFYGLPKGDENIPSADPKKEKALLDLINAERVRKGMTALQWDESLARAARYHAYDMASQEYFSHDSRDRGPKGLVRVGGAFERIRKFYKSGFANGENIAAGNSSVHGTYRQWYNSDGHNRNMFNRQSIKVGIGVAYIPDSPFGWYWVYCSASR